MSFVHYKTNDTPITLKKNEIFLYINGRSQILTLFSPSRRYHFHISTGEKGFGEKKNSFKTPRGWHYIRATVNHHTLNTCYQSRRITQKESDITSCILWLCGLETKNHHPKQHSMYRYIYIHGVPYAFKKTPVSQGCINMQNNDVLKLASLLPRYCKVYISEH